MVLMSRKKKVPKKSFKHFKNCLSILKNYFNHKEYRIWGLDISLSNPALTIYQGDINSKRVIKNMVHISHKFKGTRQERMDLIEKSFQLYAKPDLVIIEGYAYGARMEREVIGEATRCVKRSLNNVLCFIVPPQSLKKFVTGYAHRVDKKEMHETMKKWGAKTKNHDESDSAALCLMGWYILNISKIKLKNWDNKKFKYFDLEHYPFKHEEQWGVIKNVIMNDSENIDRFLFTESYVKELEKFNRERAY